jgi:hypothetical protein
LTALQVFLSVGRWQLALAGEEKEIAVLASSAFLFFYLDHRGLWSLHITSFSILAPRWRRFLLGALLALAMSIHIQNGLLVVWLLFDLLLTLRKPNLRRQAATRCGGRLARFGSACRTVLCVAGQRGRRCPHSARAAPVLFGISPVW